MSMSILSNTYRSPIPIVVKQRNNCFHTFRSGSGTTTGYRSKSGSISIKSSIHSNVRCNIPMSSSCTTRSIIFPMSMPNANMNTRTIVSANVDSSRFFSSMNSSVDSSISSIGNISDFSQRQQQIRYLSSSGGNTSIKTTGKRRIRRRRDGGGGEVATTDMDHNHNTTASKNQNNNDDDDDNSMPILSNEKMVTNKQTFLTMSHQYLTKVMKALEPMVHCNDVFHIKRSRNERGEILTIGLTPSEGQYILQVDEELFTLSLKSPMSGNYTYVLCRFTNEFIGMEDEHSFEGMLVRDLIRHCNGLPKF